MKFLWALCLALLAFVITPASAAVRLPHLFSDGMVLQREKPVPVWGWAAPGEKVTVRFAGQQTETTASANGDWMARLNPLAAGSEPQTLTVANVLVGDVWFFSGDFGVYWQTYAVVNADAELAAANYPSIRLMRVPLRTSNTPQPDMMGTWTACEPHTVNSFSALAYFFGRALHQELKVPIGLIDCSYRYSYARTFISPEGIRMVPELKAQRERLDSFDSTTETGRAAYTATIAQVEAWLPQAEEALKTGKLIPPQPLFPAPITARDDNYNSIGELCVAYYGMVHPIIPFAIRGMVWSQGENGGENGLALAYLRGLAGGYRKLWGQGDFPFLIESLQAVNAPAVAPPASDYWASLREEQLAASSIPNSGVAVTFDVSDYISETRNRQEPGRRLALIALAKEYGKPVVYSGPWYKSSRVEGDSMVVSFDHVGGGLTIGNPTQLKVRHEMIETLKGFAIAGADKKWQWAEARIVGDTVVVHSAAVPAPVAVRYAYSSNPQGANLYNRDGLSAAPFRSDNW